MVDDFDNPVLRQQVRDILSGNITEKEVVVEDARPVRPGVILQGNDALFVVEVFPGKGLVILPGLIQNVFPGSEDDLFPPLLRDVFQK